MTFGPATALRMAMNTLEPGNIKGLYGTFTMLVKNKPYTDKRLFSFFERLIPKV